MKTPKEYKREKDSFYILEMIRNNKTSLCFTDQENYLIGRYQEGLPTWIWTKDNLLQEKEKEVIKLIKENYLKETSPFTCKKEFYKILSNNFQTTDYFEMGFLSCKKLKDIKLSSGFMDYPSREDKDCLKTYWVDFNKVINPDKKLTEEELEQEINKWYEEKNFFVWRNNSGKVVSVAAFKTEGKMAKISHVYTPIKERRKGYCASLIYSITKILLEKNYQPMLYTDLNYVASNAAYQKVGYEYKTTLINFKIVL